jgi:putative transcriptional regulator
LIAIGVAHDDQSPAGWQPIHGRLGVVDLRADVTLAQGEIAGMRLFAGYAGWEGGQLEDEIAAGAWFVVAPQPDDALTTAPDELWRTVLARQGGLFKTVPLDPSLN